MIYKCKHFTLSELLPKELMDKKSYGWGTFDERLKITIDVIRDILGIPLTCNNWESGGNRNYSGARPKDTPYYKYGSYHSIRPDRKVMAVDLVSTKMSASEMRIILVQNAKSLPYPIRIEDGVNWLHVDLAAVPGYKIYFFKP